MSSLFESMSNIEEYTAFRQAMEAVGARLSESIVAQPYSGSDVLATAVLEMRVGFRRWVTLALGTDRRGMNSIKHFVSNLPLCRTWRTRVAYRPSRVEPVFFALVQRYCFEGASPDAISAVIRRHGGDDDDVLQLTRVEEKLLGYIPWRDERSARAIACLVDGGAMSPADPVEVAAMREHMVEVARHRQR